MQKYFHFAFCLAFSAALVYGQADTATIVGTVRDSSGAIIVGGTITVTATDTGNKTVARTDSSGNYVVTPLRIGNYSVAVEAPGFKTETHSGIVLQVQDRVRVDFTMQIGAVSDTVSVQESTPVIQTETSALGDVVASQCSGHRTDRPGRCSRGSQYQRTAADLRAVFAEPDQSLLGAAAARPG